MAVNTAPTKSTIVTRAITDAGYSSPSTAQTTVAEARWWALISNDIWQEQKKLKDLMSTRIGVTTKGLSRYSYPTDYSSDLSVVLMDGSETGTAQAGTTSSVTLASTADLSEGSVQGKEILITAGTGAGSLSQITSYNNSTKVASVNPNFATAPDSSSTYLIIDTYYPVKQATVWDFDKNKYPNVLRRPTEYSPIGDEDYGEFIFNYAPDKVYGMRMRYYANLMTIDEATTQFSTLIQNWENVFYKGIYAMQLKTDDDNRWIAADADYRGALRRMVFKEKYGSDISQLNAQVEDYY